MLDEFRRWLERAAKNPLLGIVWTVYVACFWYAVDQAQSFDQRLAELGKFAQEIRTGQSEIAEARKMVDTWEKTIDQAANDIQEYDKKISPDGYAPEHIRPSTLGLIEVMERSRLQFARASGAMGNTYYSIESLKELREKLIADLNFTDEVSARRIEFLRLQLVDMEKARQMVPDIISNVPEMRRVIEGEKRQKYAADIDERARQDLNVRVREYNAQSAAFHRSITYEAVASGYVVMVTAITAVYALRYRRERRKKTAEEPAGPGA